MTTRCNGIALPLWSRNCTWWRDKLSRISQWHRGYGTHLFKLGSKQPLYLIVIKWSFVSLKQLQSRRMSRFTSQFRQSGRDEIPDLTVISYRECLCRNHLLQPYFFTIRSSTLNAAAPSSSVLAAPASTITLALFHTSRISLIAPSTINSTPWHPLRRVHWRKERRWLMAKWWYLERSCKVCQTYWPTVRRRKVSCKGV